MKKCDYCKSTENVQSVQIADKIEGLACKNCRDIYQNKEWKKESFKLIDQVEEYIESFVDPIIEFVEDEGEKPRTICIDFDGVIAEHSDTHEMPTEVITGAKEGLNWLKKHGWTIIIFTCREDDNELQEFLNKFDFPYDHINCQPGKLGPKPLADIYLDDRAIEFDGDWGFALEKIENFCPWHKRGDGIVKLSAKLPSFEMSSGESERYKETLQKFFSQPLETGFENYSNEEIWSWLESLKRYYNKELEEYELRGLTKEDFHDLVITSFIQSGRRDLDLDSIKKSLEMGIYPPISFNELKKVELATLELQDRKISTERPHEIEEVEETFQTMKEVLPFSSSVFAQKIKERRHYLCKTCEEPIADVKPIQYLGGWYHMNCLMPPNIKKASEDSYNPASNFESQIEDDNTKYKNDTNEKEHKPRRQNWYKRDDINEVWQDGDQDEYPREDKFVHKPSKIYN